MVRASELELGGSCVRFSPELGIFSELSGVRNLLLPNYPTFKQLGPVLDENLRLEGVDSFTFSLR